MRKNLNSVGRGYFYFSSWSISIFFGLVLFLAVGISLAFAGPFAPGETLDPGCSPGAANCTVLQISVATSTNKFGIGTTTPWAKFSVAGVASLGSAPLFTVSSSTASATSTVFHIDYTGNVGIGTTSPYAKLSVVGEAVASYFSATSTTATSTFAGGVKLTKTGTGIEFADGTILTTATVGGGSGTVNSATAIGQVPYYAAASNAVTATSTIFISTASNVGIGTTTPEAKLEIAGNLFFSSGSTRRIQVGTTTSAVGSSFEILGADALSADVTTVGGSILIRGGKGAGTGFPNTGGAVSVLGGGALDESPGGAVTVAGGDAAVGGAATFRAGDSTSLNGGNATFRAGNGEAGSGAGGGATFAAGDGATAGDTNIRAGDGTAAGDTIIRAGDGNGAGYTSIRGGNGFSGGRVEINGGTGTGGGAGVITIAGGTDNAGTGGSVTITGGNDSGSGTPGNVTISGGGAGAGGNGNVILAAVSGTPQGFVGIATSTPWGQLSVHVPGGIPSFVVGSSSATHFIVAENGRVGIGTTTPFALLALNGGANSDGTTWNNASSRSLKENFVELDSFEVLGKINNLSITRWNYKTQSPDTTHIGPIAEEFYDAFAVGGPTVGKSSISSIDPAGVALIGIQALSRKIEALESRSYGGGGISFSAVLNSLKDLGADIVSGLATFKDLIAETLTAKKLCLEEVCITKAELQSLLDKNGLTGQPAAVSESVSETPVTETEQPSPAESETTPEGSNSEVPVAEEEVSADPEVNVEPVVTEPEVEQSQEVAPVVEDAPVEVPVETTNEAEPI